MKKNTIKRCMAMMLSLIPFFSVACTKDEPSSSSSPVADESMKEPKENKYKLIEDGLSEYVIILPEKGESGETLASGILTSNLYNATGCKLEYKTDAEYNATQNSKFISIGETKAYLDANLSVDKNTLNGDGFVIKTVGDDIYIVGGKNSNSYIYSAYDLLKIFIDYEAYADDEIYYRSTKNVGFDDIDITEIPDIAYRHLYNSWATAPNNLTLTDQILRTHKNNWSSYGDGHTIFYFLPPDTYAKEHPEWYSGTTPGRGQICWSNEELLEEMTKQVIEHIKKESSLVTNVMVAQNDGGVWCSCEACVESKTKYGTDSAAVVKAINKIAEAVENYLLESGQAERELYITTFAYLQTKEPPVKEEGGKFVPIDESVRMRKNTAVRIAPIEMNYSVAANHETNYLFRDIFMGWSAVCDNLMIWDYSVNPSDYLVPQIADFSVLQDNYRFFKECGVYNVHPTDENAYEFYDGIYGKLLKACPKIKGIFLLGEATEFSSKDPNVGFAPRQKNYIDNIPTGKCTPGWWPCSDYAEWVDLIKKVARKYNSDLDVVLSTYNWGYAPEKDRIALINRLPQDVSINVTWDMFEQVQMGNSVQDVVDYSLNFVGPGKYFTSEAIAAKKRGIKLMANSQTSGRTWDFGMVPYEPMPYQWIKRYNGLIKASKTWDLKIIYENIHYAFQPSIISELEKYMFFTPFDGGYTPERWLEKLIERDFGAENANRIDEAFKLFSEGITKYPATNEDQYGVFRTGPSYPFWMVNPKLGLNPLPEDGMIPVSRFNAEKHYFSWYTPDIAGRNSLPGVRIFDEIALITQMRDSFIKGFKALNEIQDETVNLIKLKALAKFMINSCTTAINYKNFYIKLQQLSCVGDKFKAQALIDEIEQILIAERENAQDTISAVKVDSRLGWESEEDYLCDENALLWKMRQIDHELNFTIKKFRESNSL